MSTSSFTTFGMPAALTSDIPDSQRATAEALFKMVRELEQTTSIGSRLTENYRIDQLNPLCDSTNDMALVEHPAASELISSDIDVSKTFCEWLTSVRSLQKNPCDRKKMIASFAMLVFHSGVGNTDLNSAEEIDLLSKEQLNFVSRAPGWNQNERRILAVLKNHFHTLKRLSGTDKNGISYADMSSLFVSKKRLRERLAMTASEKCAKSGMGIGLIIQVLLIVAFIEFGLNISMFFGVIGALTGLYREKSFSGSVVYGLKGLVWGLSAGSALGAVVGVNQANRQFDESLANGVDSLREDLAELCFEAI